MVETNNDPLQKKLMPLIDGNQYCSIRFVENLTQLEKTLQSNISKYLQGIFNEDEQFTIQKALSVILNKNLLPLDYAEVLLLLGSTTTSFQQIAPLCELINVTAEESNIDWETVYALFPQTVGNQINPDSIRCLAFLIAFFKSVHPTLKFPIEHFFRTKWFNLYNQANFLRTCIYSIIAEDPQISSSFNANILNNGNCLNFFSPNKTSKYLPHISPQHIYSDPHYAILKTIEIPADEDLLTGIQPKLIRSPVNRIWSNGVLLGFLLELASEKIIDNSRIAYEKDEGVMSRSVNDNEKEAASIACDLLRFASINCPALLLATIIKSSNIQPNTGRIFATELLGMFKNYVQLTPSESVDYFYYVATINPSKFVSNVLKAAYMVYTDRLPQIVLALKFNNQLLLKALNGPLAPFRFYLLHAAWSKTFNSGLWLQERLKHDTLGKTAKEFLLFLILTLCPPEILQQQLCSPTKQPMRRLPISRAELTFYLYSIVNTLKDSSVHTVLQIPQDMTWASICIASPDVLDCHLVDLKEACAILHPQLAPFISLINPSTETSNYDIKVSDNATYQNHPAKVTDKVPSQENLLVPEQLLEQEVHRYFALLYAGSMSCDTLIELMSKLSTCPPKSQKYQVFHYIIQLIFHECRYFTKYPLTELAMTAQLMGKMIHREILVGHGPQKTAHMMAIRCVIEGLRKGDSSKMFRFGVTALEQFFGPIMLCSPDFVTALIAIPDMRTHYPMYIAYAKECLKVMPPSFLQMRYIKSSLIMQHDFPPAPAPYVHPVYSLTPYCLPDADANYGPNIVGSAMDALNNQKSLMINGQPIELDDISLGWVDKLFSAEPALWVPEPPQSYIDQITQTFNSLSTINIKAKADELRSKIHPDWLKYLALYIVKSRALKEDSNHSTYSEFLDCLKTPKLFDMVVTVTYNCINVLLMYCDAAKGSFSYRRICRSLGSWLGSLTLAHNYPLRSKLLDIKTLIFDGYENGRLKMLLALCCRILYGIKQSRNFKPPNPWSVGIFNLIAELHAVPNLHHVNSFEIELLFKHLDLDIADYANKSNQLRKRNFPLKNSPDFTYDNNGSRNNINPQTQTPHQNIVPQNLPQMQHQIPPQVQPQIQAKLQSQLQSQIQQQIQQQRQHQMQNQIQSQTPLHMQLFSQLQQPMQSQLQMPHHMQPRFPTIPNPSQPSYPCPEKMNMQYPPVVKNIKLIARNALATDADLVSTFDPITDVPNPIFPQTSKPPVEPQTNLLAILMKSVVVSPSLALFQLKPFLKSIIPNAIEMAIKEVLQVVCEKSVLISSVTTKEIVLKDFAGEINDSLVRRAAYLMAASLAGSLALVTCRESLRKAICQHIKNMLITTSSKLSEDQRLIDQVVSVLAADNIELGCSVIEEAVIQKALHRIEQIIAPDLMERRRAKAIGSNKYQDPKYPASHNNLSPCFSQKIQVYKDFLNFGSLKRMQSDNFIGNQTRFNEGCSDFSTVNNMPSNASEQVHSQIPIGVQSLDPSVTTTRVDECLVCLKELIQEIAFCFPILPYKFGSDIKYAEPAHHIVQFAENYPAVNTSLLTLSRLNSDHDIFALIIKLSTICTLCVDPKAAFLTCAQKVLKMLTDAAALHHEPLIILRNSDVAGLYVETCFGVLACAMRSEEFPKEAFEKELHEWIGTFLENKKPEPDIALNSVRYKIITYKQLNTIIMKKLVVFTEIKNSNIFSNVLLLLYKILNEIEIIVPDKKAALTALKDCRDFIEQQQIPESGDEPSEFFPSVISLDGTELISLANARAIILDQIRSALAGESSEITPNKDISKVHVIDTIVELIENYATFGGPIFYTRKYPLPAEISPAQFGVISSRFHQWMFCYLIVSSEKRTKVWAEYFQRLSKQRLLQMDDRTYLFLIGCLDRATQISVTESPVSYNKETTNHNAIDQPPQVEIEVPNLKPLDAFAKMVVAMMRLIDSSQISLVLILQRALSVIVRCMHRDAQSPKDFNPIVYNRLFLSLLWEIVQPNQGLDDQLTFFMLSFANALQAVNPCVIPAFAFCWVELISHRSFLPKILKQHREWSNFQSLLTSLFRFLYCFLQRGKFSKGINLLYKATLRLLLVLLHDYSEILCDHYIILSENLPLNCVQLRNIILSAVPHDIKLPNPFTSTLNVESLPESRKPLKLPNHSVALLITKNLKQHINDYNKTRDTKHLDLLLQKFKITNEHEIATIGINYDISCIHAVLLLAVASIPIDKFNLFKNEANTQVPAVQMILYFINNLDDNGRYVLINAISNQLRYPNIYTHFFSCLLLWLFNVSTEKEYIQEQITRVLLERLVTHRPHPWGILITFIELIKNPRFNFWNCTFVHSVPEVHKLFQSVAQTSFGQSNPIPQQTGEDRQIEIF